mmetsp:Transcript_43511/g.144942  ORF Transcript_43511/g.144942 Transcript_43511/m.144942 type:complete len:96 (-) Transcript_43511:1030-1317(-)
MWRVWARGRGFERVQWLHGPCGRPEQRMLQPEAVCLVDGGACIFVWVGRDASEEDEALATALASRYGQTFEPATRRSEVLAGSDEVAASWWVRSR